MIEMIVSNVTFRASGLLCYRYLTLNQRSTAAKLTKSTSCLRSKKIQMVEMTLGRICLTQLITVKFIINNTNTVFYELIKFDFD